MPISPNDQLKEQIESIPARLRQVLEQQATARIEVARLEAQIEKLEAELAIENNSMDDSNLDVDSLEDELALFQLESTLRQLKLDVEEAENKAEIECRASPGKITEGHVKMVVASDPNVMRLKRECLKAEDAVKEKKLRLEHEQHVAREAKAEVRRKTRIAIEPENEEMSSLQSQLISAKETLIHVDLEVEVIRATMDIYQMLVQLS